jgi:hypothetical protein
LLLELRAGGDRITKDADPGNALLTQHRRYPLTRRLLSQASRLVPCRRQYVARPPERSNTAPVEKLQSPEAKKAIRAATSSGRPRRFIGIRSTM